MQPLPAGRLYERVQAQPGQTRTKLKGRLHHVRERHRWIGVQVEHQPVGSIEPILACSPGVDLQHSDLNQEDDPAAGRNREVLRLFLTIELDLHPLQIPRMLVAGTSLHEAVTFPSLWAAEQRQRSILDFRDDPVGNGEIVFCQLALRDALIRPQHLVRARKPDSVDRHGVVRHQVVPSLRTISNSASVTG